ncbi:hypothetical protein CBM2599_U20011 [Cupriavidus taiwanensis]|nr:hypothetical protein CBM2599_U20011 [Cupriavidus taiwanensis]
MACTGQKPRPRGRQRKGETVEGQTFYDRADKALKLYGLILPADIRQLLRDMAGAIDKLQEQKQ